MKKNDKVLYNKEHLILFSRENEDYVIWGKNASKYIKEDKNYCFVGLINSDCTKIKNVLTGEVYRFFGIYKKGKVRINKQTYVSINLGYDYENNYIGYSSYARIKHEKNNCDIYLLNLSNDDKTEFNEYAGNSSYGTMDITSIKKLVTSINNSIHNEYKKNIKQYNKIVKQSKVDEEYRKF